MDIRQAIESIDENVICACGTIVQKQEYNDVECMYCPNCSDQGDLEVDQQFITVPITEEQVGYSEYMGKKIKEDKASDKNDYTPNYMNKDGDEVNFTGVLGEVVVADLLDKDRPELQEDEVDDGYDFIIQDEKIDVKTTDYPDREDVFLIVYPFDMGEKDVEGYLMINIDTDQMVAEMLMQVSYEEFVARNTTRDLGYGKRLTIQVQEAEDDILINPST